MKRRLGFISGNPRVSTCPDAGAVGARSHIMGVTGGFKKLGWEVEPFVVGDRVPQRWVTAGSEQSVRRKLLHALAADLVLPILCAVNARRAWRELGGRVDWAYERHYAFGSLGLAFKRRGVPWILEANESFFYEIEASTANVVLSGLVRRLEIRAYKSCDVLICVSETLKNIVVREAGVPSEKVVVVPNAVDPTVFDPEAHEPKRFFEDFTIGYVGELYPHKGLEPLIEALSELRAEGLKMSLVVLGDGRMREAWEKLARASGISEHVAFVGRVRWEEVSKFIAGLDLGYCGQVRTKARETYDSPLKLYEYMAMAKPVVASDLEDASRVVWEGETGFLFRAGDKADLKRALRRAYEARLKLSWMGDKAREQIVSEHNWTGRVRDIISAVEDRLRTS